MPYEEDNIHRSDPEQSLKEWRQLLEEMKVVKKANQGLVNLLMIMVLVQLCTIFLWHWDPPNATDIAVAFICFVVFLRGEKWYRDRRRRKKL